MSFGQHIYLIKSELAEQGQITKDWSSSFHGFLELLLTRLSGEPIKINVINDEDFDIDSIYSASTILLPLVSNELLNSPRFKEEIKAFHEKAINKSHNTISWNSRIFNIVKEPQKGHFLLDYLSDSVSYDFFHVDSTTDELVVYDDFTGPSSERTFWMRLYDLAYDIFKVMDGIKSMENELASISNDMNSIRVYLAEVGADLIAKRDVIKRELMRSGYKVLPEKSMPKDMDSIMRMVKKDIASCNMSIHLVGSDYGKIQGTNSSIIDLQNRIATDYFNDLEKMDAVTNLNFGRIIWVDGDMHDVSVKQRLYIENLKKDSNSMKKADLLETSIEELKAFALNKIEDGVRQYNQFKKGVSAEKGKIVYLIHDRSEIEKCKKIQELLENSGYEVINSDFNGSPDEVRIQHSNNLKRCDATLIYYGNENGEWIKTKQKDLLKSLGLGREKPISPQAILIENQSQLEEVLNLGQNALVIQSNNEFSTQVIEPFLSELEK